MVAEVPTFAMASLAVVVLFLALRRRSRTLLFGSGAILGCACLIKFTAMLFAPSAIVEIVLMAGLRFRDRLLNACVWIGGVAFCSTLGLLVLVQGNVDSLFTGHFTSSPAFKEMASRYRLPMEAILANWDMLLTVWLVLILAIVKRGLALIRFPLVLLITVTLVHSIHRPWWYYYWVHFAIPFAWLATVATLHVDWRRIWGSKGMEFIKVLIVSVLIVSSGVRFADNITFIFSRPKRIDNQILAEVEKAKPGVSWILADDNFIPFYANIPVPPEIALRPEKRFWSGQITHEQILDVLTEYRPGLIIAEQNTSPAFQEYFNNSYAIVFTENNRMVLRRK